jgi:hypothetical protein
MKFEYNDVPKYRVERDSVESTRSIRPLLYLSYKVSDTTTTGTEFERFRRKLEIDLTWITKIDVKSFTDLRREAIREQRTQEGKELEDEMIENILLEELVNANIEGNSGSTTYEYEELVRSDFTDLKKSIDNTDGNVDWGRLFSAELSNRNRDDVKDWINRKRREKPGRAYDSIQFSQLKNSDFYPERISTLGFGLPGQPDIEYWNDVGSMIGYTPSSQNMKDMNQEEQEKYQRMSEKYSNIGYNFSSRQVVRQNTDGSFALVGGDSLAERIPIGQFKWYFRRSIPDSHLNRAAEIHGYDSEEQVISAVYKLVSEKIKELSKEYNLTSSNLEEHLRSKLSI